MAKPGEAQPATLQEHRAQAGDVQQRAQYDRERRCERDRPSHCGAPTGGFDAEKQQKWRDIADHRARRFQQCQVLMGSCDHARGGHGDESPDRVEPVQHQARAEDGQNDEADLGRLDRSDGRLKRLGADHVGRRHLQRQTGDQQPANPGRGEVAAGQHNAAECQERADQARQQRRSKPGGGDQNGGKTGHRDQRRSFPGSGPGRHGGSLAGDIEEMVYVAGFPGPAIGW